MPASVSASKCGLAQLSPLCAACTLTLHSCCRVTRAGPATCLPAHGTHWRRQSLRPCRAPLGLLSRPRAGVAAGQAPLRRGGAACMNPRRPRGKATICIQEHVAIDMCPGPICPSSRFLPTSFTSRGSCPMTPLPARLRPAPAPAAPPTAPAMTTRMGTISSESKDSVRVPALCSLPPSRQRTSWTSKATSGRLQGEQEDWHLHDTGLGALAAGLKVVSYEILWNLPGDVAEAAGGRPVSTNCGERKRMSLRHISEEEARQLLIPEQLSSGNFFWFKKSDPSPREALDISRETSKGQGS